MKIIIIVLFHTICFSQIKELTVTYQPFIVGSYINEETKKNNPDFANQYNGIEDLINNKKVYLYFKDSISIYKTNEQLKTDEQEESVIVFTADLLIDANSIYIKNTQNNKTFHQTEFSSKLYTVELFQSIFEWKLLSESKQLDGFTVFKATTYDTRRKTEITAWYAPQIPLSIGPMNYNNLPGIVLEIEIGNKFKFVAKKIDFKTNEIINFNQPMENLISEEKFNLRVDIMAKEMFEK